jgi:hypothetical protein
LLLLYSLKQVSGWQSSGQQLFIDHRIQDQEKLMDKDALLLQAVGALAAKPDKTAATAAATSAAAATPAGVGNGSSSSSSRSREDEDLRGRNEGEEEDGEGEGGVVGDSDGDEEMAAVTRVGGVQGTGLGLENGGRVSRGLSKEMMEPLVVVRVKGEWR